MRDHFLRATQGASLVGALATSPALHATPAEADRPAQPERRTDGAQPGVAHSLGAAVGASNFDDAIGRLEYRLRLAGGTQLGLDARASVVDEAFVSGYAASGGQAYRGLVFAQLPVLREGPLELDLRAGAGASQTAADRSRGPEADATAVLAEFGMIGGVRASRVLTLRAGVLSPFSMQVAPETDLDVTGALLLAGLAWAVSDQLWLHADLETGGIFGSDGNAGKYLATGFVGLRWILGDATTTSYRTF